MRYLWFILGLCPIVLWGQDMAFAKKQVEQAELALDSAQYHQAYMLANEALDVFGTASIEEKGDAYNVIGYCYLEQGDKDKGKDYFEKGLSVFKKLFGESHPSVAQSYNNIGNYHLQKGEFTAAIEQYQKAANRRIQLLGMQHEKTADAIDNIGVALAGMGDYAQAFGWHQQALEIRQNVLGKTHPDIAQSYQNMGNCYYFSGVMEEALDYYEQCIDLRQKTLGVSHPKLAQAYNNRGNVHLQDKQVRLAQADYRQALQIHLKNFGASHPSVAESRMNLGNCASQEGRFEAATALYQQALEVQRENLGAAHPKLADTYDNLGHCFLEIGDIGEALDYYEQSAAIRAAAFEAGHPYLSYNYENLGLCYQAQGDYEKAIDFHLKSLDIRLKTFGDKNELVAGNYNNLGNNYFEQEDFENALLFYRKTIPVFTKKQGLDYLNALANTARAEAKMGDHRSAIARYQRALKIDVYEEHPARAGVLKDWALSLMELGDFEGAMDKMAQAERLLWDDAGEELRFEAVQAPNVLLTVLMAKGGILERQFDCSGDTSYLKKSVDVHESALELLDLCFLLYQNFLSKKITNEYNFKIHEILLRHHSNNPRKAFAISEKSKNLLLLDAARRSNIQKMAGIDDSLFLEEKNLQKQLAQLEKKRLDNQQRSEQERQQLVDSTFLTKQKLRRTISKIETQNPKLYQAKYAGNTTTIPNIQKTLEANQAVVEYFAGDSSIYVFIIKKDTLHLHRIQEKIQLKTLVQQLEDGIKYYHDSGTPTPDLYMETINEYSYIAHEIYRLFFQPIEQYGLPDELIIVPDGGLGFVPFAALLKTQPEEPHRFKTHDYLLKYHSFSYAYSASLWLEMKNNYSQASKKLLAFAPDFNEGEYAPLRHNKTEIEAIQKIWGGDCLTGKNASAHQFDSLAPHYEILHFATHGEANTKDGDFSFMVLGGDSTKHEKRYARDLYAMQLNSKMTVLSACETGNGKYWRGEGIISLARGFAYAGSASVLTTLWSANDAKTAQIMPAFYKNLKKGQPKNQALQQAQLEYLNKQAHDEAHPYFWSSFILIGDEAPIEKPIPFSTYLLLAITFVTFVWLIIKKTGQS